ncbi:hypothetical protein [Paenibacillus glycanilyticus]|uniref:hypothetical protein n=1 Tax=Paenibacillus glycanilyticus TaxID=126569 RepID=UPI003EBA12CF
MKWLIAILYHPLMILMIPITLLMPIMVFSDAVSIIENEVPASTIAFTIIGFSAFLVYIATRSQFFGKPYRKITILLPLLHMCIYTCAAINTGIVILNKWADEALFSKAGAVTLALIAFIVTRLLMSLLYWKYPMIQRVPKEET